HAGFVDGRIPAKVALDTNAVEWDSRSFQTLRQSEKRSPAPNFSGCVVLDVALVEYEARLRVRGRRGVKCDVDILRANQVKPWLAPQSVGAVVMIDRLIHHVPGVHTAGIVLDHSGNVIRHDLLSVRSRDIGLEPFGKRIPPTQAVATEKQAVCAGPIKGNVARAKIIRGRARTEPI